MKQAINNEQAPLARVAHYYAVCAPTYDATFEQSGRAALLAPLHARVAELVRGHAVLELACGSGYWTEVLARGAAQVLATDAVEPMLDLARRRALPANVTLRRMDGTDLPDDLGAYSCVFIGFWWSHLTRDEQDAFLSQLRARVGKNALLVLVDDVYVEGVSLPIARTDLLGNTYEIATTPSGERVELTKNYPSDSALRKRLGAAAKEIRVKRDETTWLLTCRLK
jgi:ubiquinone/menaquinone biosynthesis C-methylase UbiE